MAKTALPFHTPITAQYTLSDFERIIHNGFEYSVSPEVVALVSKLADQVGAPTYVKTPVFPKNKSSASSAIGSLTCGTSSHPASLASSSSSSSSSLFSTIMNSSDRDRDRDRNDRRGGAANSRRVDSQQITDEDWEAIRAFQATEMARSQGIETNISAIRSSLNRITADNYAEMRDAILQEIDNLNSNNADEESMLKIGNSIFNTASSNQFYSHMYATLFKDLLARHEFFKTIFETSMSDYIKLFRKIEYADPKKDYDKFCEMNKANDKRKAMSLFIVNLMKEGVVPVTQVVELVLDLQRMLNDYLKIAGKTNELDEISETVYIIIKNGHTVLSSTEEWINILNNVTFVSLLKVKSYPSITNKTIFKHNDILELFQ
jgi:hypothetical protein